MVHSKDRCSMWSAHTGAEIGITLVLQCPLSSVFVNILSKLIFLQQE